MYQSPAVEEGVDGRGVTGGGRPKAPHPPSHFPFLHAWRGRLVTSPEKGHPRHRTSGIEQKVSQLRICWHFPFLSFTSIYPVFRGSSQAFSLRVLPPASSMLGPSHWFGSAQMTPVPGYPSSRLQVVLPYPTPYPPFPTPAGWLSTHGDPESDTRAR